MQAYDDRNFNYEDGFREAFLADLLDYAIVGAAHMERGLTDFPRCSQAMMACGYPAGSGIPAEHFRQRKTHPAARAQPASRLIQEGKFDTPNNSVLKRRIIRPTSR